MARAQCDRPLDDAHSLQLHMSAEKSASAVVFPINTQKLVNSFNFFKNGEFSPKNAKNEKMFQI
jgi:hypothetical protein